MEWHLKTIMFIISVPEDHQHPPDHHLPGDVEWRESGEGR